MDGVRGGQRAYDALKSVFHEIGVLRSIAGTLNWDAAVNLPSGGRRIRGEQLALINDAIYDRLSTPCIDDTLAAAREDDHALTAPDRANLRLMQREVEHITAAPKDLSSSLVRAQAMCEGVWITAKPDNDFAAVLPFANDVLDLTRQTAQAKSAVFGGSPHEALMDYWDPRTSAGDLDVLFASLKDHLPSIVDDAMKRQADHGLPNLPTIPKTVQLEVCRRIALTMGYDFDHGRIDESAQAFFVDDSPEDVRITTRCDERDYRSAVFGILHEIGHSFYERAMPADWRYQPIGRPASAGMQESQSLLFENLIARHPAFIAMIAGHIDSVFAETGLNAERIRQHVHHVERTLLRTDADEVTYPLHVVIRYELEQALLSGALSFAELPGAWREKYTAVLGVSPPDDRQGCLQDIHWYRGLYGYFQSYALGSLISAQLLETALCAITNAETGLDVAHLAPLKDWLTDKIYRQGRAAPAAQLVEHATGRPLSVEPFLVHLQKRYA